MATRLSIVLLVLFLLAAALWISNAPRIEEDKATIEKPPPASVASDLDAADGLQPGRAPALYPDPLASIDIAALPLESLCLRVFNAINEADVEFAVSGIELRTASYAALDRIVNFADNCTDGAIEIVGHTDSLGDDAVNLHVGQLRARAVASYLRAGGVPANRLKIASRGSSQPIADNETRSGRAKNRRIEFRLLKAPVSN